MAGAKLSACVEGLLPEAFGFPKAFGVDPESVRG